MTNLDDEIDVSGMSCPMPLIQLSKTVVSIGPGRTLKIKGDDPVFEQGVRDFCELNHHEILSVFAGEGRKVEIVIKTSE